MKSADPGCVIYAAVGAWSKSVEDGKRNGGSSGKLNINMEIHPTDVLEKSAVNGQFSMAMVKG